MFADAINSSIKESLTVRVTESANNLTSAQTGRLAASLNCLSVAVAMRQLRCFDSTIADVQLLDISPSHRIDS